jgi:predicted nucleic acid-binding protein
VKKQTGFWDASALVPLCVHEKASQQAQAYLRKYTPAVCWGSLVEVQSAVARLHRQGLLNDSGKQGALARLAVLARGWKEILPDDTLRALAGDLLNRYTLRSADSLQLAAALTWCQQRPAKRIFVSGDQRLCVAAEEAGFLVLQLAMTAP